MAQRPAPVRLSGSSIFVPSAVKQASVAAAGFARTTLSIADAEDVSFASASSHWLIVSMARPVTVAPTPAPPFG